MNFSFILNVNKLTKPLGMNDEGEMFLVQNPVQLLEGRVQRDLVEGVVGRVSDGILKRNFSLQNFRLQTAQSRHSDNCSKVEKVFKWSIVKQEIGKMFNKYLN